MDTTTGNQYLYDAEGRICAVENLTVGTMTGYIYDADGTRVAKGSITSWSCDPTVNGFQTASDYVLGPSGEQVTEMAMDPNGNMAWQHTNVWAGGRLLATYDADGLHFYFDDPLGTRRVQTDYEGVVEQTCVSLPYGDGLSCTGSTITPTEHHFTGKERDTESGNDYFGARYYASSMGRFMSPDPLPWIHWQNGSSDDQQKFAAYIANPQNLNMYVYVLNNPLSKTDPTGMNPCGTKSDADCHVTVTFKSRSKDANGNYNDSNTNVKGQEFYNATATINVNGKDVGTYLARTIPSDGSNSATIADGTYQGTWSGHAGYPAISLNSGGPVPTVAPNPSSGPNHGKDYATGIYGPHIGGYDPTKFAPQGPIFDSRGHAWSTGCSLINRDQYGDFMDKAGMQFSQYGDSPPQQHFTVIYDTNENQ
jgi:RHS repeat-associated protein